MSGAPEPLVVEHVTPDVFLEARNRSPYMAYLSELTPADLADHRLIMNTPGSGVAIAPDGDDQNLFRLPGVPKGMGARALLQAIEFGGRTLDCYDGVLPDYYATFGFIETARVRFDPRFAHGVFADCPDVIYMQWEGWPPGGAQAAIARAADRSRWNLNIPAEYVFDDVAARRTYNVLP
jgi:hypothetical protein